MAGNSRLFYGIIMRLSDGCIINNVARLEKQEEIEESSEKIEKEIEKSTEAEEKVEYDSVLPATAAQMRI